MTDDCLNCNSSLKNITSRNSVCEDCITSMVTRNATDILLEYGLDSKGNIIPE